MLNFENLSPEEVLAGPHFSFFVRVHLIHGLLFRRCGQTCLAPQATLIFVRLSGLFCAGVSKKKKKERKNAGGGGVSVYVCVCVCVCAVKP